MPPARFNELGVSGLKHFSGTIYEEFLLNLRGERGQKIYREMSLNSPVIRSMLFAVESLLRSVDWTVEPASESQEDIDNADFLQECMLDMSHTWEDFISEVLSMLTFGWSYFEIVYKRRNGLSRSPGKGSRFDDGRIGWRKFAPRPQETLYRWEIGPDGGVDGMWQWPNVADVNQYRIPQNTVLIPIEKALLFRTTSTKNNPEGQSVLRGAYRPWYFSKRIEEIEAIGVERDLAGMPIAGVPLDVLAEVKSAEAQATYDYVRDIVTRVKRDEQEGIVWPLVYDENGNQMYTFELINSGGSRQFDTSTIVQRYMQQMAMTIMADFILLGHENVGSFALSSDKTELFAVALGSWLDSIEEVLNRHAVTRLFELNGIAGPFPHIRHGDIEKPDVNSLATFLKEIASAGAPVFPDLVLENRLREMADLPPIDPEEREEMLASQEEGGMFGTMMGGGEELENPTNEFTPSPDDLNAPVKKSRASNWPEEEPFRRPKGKSRVIRPRYFDGNKWRPVHGRRNLL